MTTTNAGEPSELLPCPFCGAPAELDAMQGYRMYAENRMGTRVAAYCTECSADVGLCLEDVREYSHDDVVASVVVAWNRRAALTPAPAQPEPPTAAGVEPVAFIGTRSLQWLKDHPAGETHTALFGPKDDRPSAELLSPLYATPPTLTDAQCDAIREAVSLRSTYTIDEYRARVRAAVGGAK